jgi:pimeloyl-ACP methyl ester carboxylesterase
MLVQATAVDSVQVTVRDGVRVTAESRRLVVPAVRTAPSAGVLELRFFRFPATTQRPTEPILYLAGGPGDAGSGDLAGMPAVLLDSLRSIADFIVLDQRGTGHSESRDLGCPPGPQLPLGRPGNPSLDLPPIQAHARQCVEAWRSRGIDLAAFTTEESADDVESLRSSLGAPKIALLGGSYGSHLALSVMRRHPSAITRAALFGIEGPDQTFKRPFLVDSILVRLGELARSDSVYRHALPDVEATVRRLAQRLAARPESVTVDGRVVIVGDWDLRKRIADALGRNGPMRQLPGAILTMERGDFRDLGRWALGWRRGAAWSAMGVAMDCASWASPARLALIARESRTALVGATVDYPFPDVCDVVPVPRLSDSFRAPLASQIPALLVTGDLDARTPVANTDEIARDMPNAHVLVVEHGGHGLMGYPEINPIMLAFFRGASSFPRISALPTPRFTH